MRIGSYFFSRRIAVQCKALSLLSIFLLTACASREVKMYEGDVRPDSEMVSILFRSREGPGVISVDGKDAPSSVIQIGRLIMLPGEHEYGVGAIYDVTVYEGWIAQGKVKIDGKAGHTYAFHWKKTPDPNVVNFWYEDMGTTFPKECFDIRRWWTEPERFEKLGCR